MTELEVRARRLLNAAAETIEVTATPGTGAVRRSRWPVAVAAAAVVLALLVVLPVLLDGARDLDPGQAPGRVQVPETLFMTPRQAAATLSSVGLEVRQVDEDSDCDFPPNRILRSDPPSGATVEAGSTVSVVTSVGNGHSFCVGDVRLGDAFGLFDLARFGASDLVFAPTVNIWVDGELTTSLGAGQVGDLGAWGEPSPLTRMLVSRGPSRPTTTSGGTDPRCGPKDPPASLLGRRHTVIDLVGPVDGVFGCSIVRVYRVDGRITDVTSSEWSPTSTGPEGVTVGEVEMADGRLVSAESHGGGSCVWLVGIDDRLRSCLVPPSARSPQLPIYIRADAVAQRSGTAPLEVYGTTRAGVDRVVVAYVDGGDRGQLEAALIRVTDLEVLATAGISEPFGLYVAELPPGTDLRDVTAIAYDGEDRLADADFADLTDQPRGAMIGGSVQ